MSWMDDLAQVGGGILQGVGGVASLIPGVGTAAGAAVAGLGTAWKATDNYFLQQDQNALTMQREDTAVQRRAADMSAAGFNPLLAAGNPASAQALAAPQGQQVDTVSPVINALTAKQDLALKAAQADLVSAQADKTRADTVVTGQDIEFNKVANPAKLQVLAAQVRQQDSKATMDALNAAWNATVGPVPVHDVTMPDGSVQQQPTGPAPTNFSQVQDAELAKTKALSLAAQYAPSQADQNLMATLIAVKTAGIENQFLSAYSSAGGANVEILKNYLALLNPVSNAAGVAGRILGH